LDSQQELARQLSANLEGNYIQTSDEVIFFKFIKNNLMLWGFQIFKLTIYFFEGRQKCTTDNQNGRKYLIIRSGDFTVLWYLNIRLNFQAVCFQYIFTNIQNIYKIETLLQLSPLPHPPAMVARHPEFSGDKKNRNGPHHHHPHERVSPKQRDSYQIATSPEKYAQRESTYINPK
jgi:hypothetical protein